MDPTLSEVRMFAGNFAPLSWAFCNGSLLSIAENTALFSLLGTTYGGDGQTTFALPDFRGRVALGTSSNPPGLSPVDLGQVGGSNTVTLTLGNLPSHIHPGHTQVSSANGSTNLPANAYPAVANGTISNGSGLQIASYGGAASGGMAPVQLSVVGGNQPLDVTNPYLAVNFIIAVEGIYPSRN